MIESITSEIYCEQDLEMYLHSNQLPQNLIEEEKQKNKTLVVNIDGSQEYTVQISEQVAIELEFLFDDMKHRLENANTKQEAITIFKESVLSLN